jgi:hypothetical protein
MKRSLGLSGFDARLLRTRASYDTVLNGRESRFLSGLQRRKPSPSANRLAKNEADSGGVRCLLMKRRSAKRWRVELTDIARRLAARFNAIGITTPSNCVTPIIGLSASVSAVLERMVLELRGVSCIGLEEVSPDRKCSRSFDTQSKHDVCSRRQFLSIPRALPKSSAVRTSQREPRSLDRDKQLQTSKGNTAHRRPCG